jgi:hypothetical protein
VDETPKKAPDRSLVELLQVSKKLQARSARLDAESRALSKLSERLKGKTKRILDMQRD